MTLLRSDPALLEAAGNRVAREAQIPFAHVEKDYWLTEALRAMSEYADAEHIPLIFKGGTSLSKGFKLIQRFSEDVDVLVVFPDLLPSQRDAHLKKLIEVAGTATDIEPLEDLTKADRGVKRVATLNYPKRAVDPAGAAEGVKLELHVLGGVQPRVVLPIRSLISEYIPPEEIGEAFAELEAFPVSVISPCRTLVEKLIILHGAHADTSQGSRERRFKTVRHYYDIWALLGAPDVLSDLAEADITMLAHDVAVYSQNAGLPKVDRPAGGFVTSSAFQLPPSRDVNSRYEIQVLNQLLWPRSERPSLEECIKRVIENGTSL